MQGFKDLVAAVKRCQFLGGTSGGNGVAKVVGMKVSFLGKWFLHMDVSLNGGPPNHPFEEGFPL